MMQVDINEAINTCLDDIRACVIAGRFEDLPELESRVRSLLSDPATTVLRRDFLRSLIGKAEHNEVLLNAAAKGISIASRRLAEIRRAADGIGAYNREGQSTVHHEKSASMVKRF